MKKNMKMAEIIDFDSAKKSYLKKKKLSEVKKTEADDDFSWDKIRDLKVKIVWKRA